MTHGARSPEARGTALLVFAALACVLAALSPRDLWPPDEGRYGQVAREMLASGDTLVPRLNGEPYAEKPPVAFWATSALSRPFGGVTPLTARLAAALLAAGSVGLTFRLARRFFPGRGVAPTATLFFASSGVVLWYGPRAGLDMPLTFFVLLAVERGTIWWQEGRLFPAFVCGLAWALAALVKGPMGLLLPPLALAGAGLATRRAPPWRNPGWVLVPLVLVAVGLAWLVPALEAGGPAYRERLLGQILSRASGAGEGHVRPPTYYALRSGYLLLPWSLHLLAGLGLLLRPRTWRPEDRFGLGASFAGGLVMLIALSVFATKREQYLLPLLPFIAMPGALAMREGVLPRLQEVADRLMAPLLLLFAAGALALPWIVRSRLPRGAVPAFDGPDASVLVAAALVALPLAWSGVSLLRRRLPPAALIRRTAAAMLAAAVALHVAMLPFLDPTKSYASVAAAADGAKGEGGIGYGWFNQPGNLLWNLEAQTIRRIDDVADLEAALSPTAPKIAVVLEEKHWLRLKGEAREEDPARADLFDAVEVVWQDPARRRRLVVLTNAPRPNR